MNIIDKYNGVDLHWWGNNVILINNLRDMYVLSAEETFLVECMSITNDVDELKSILGEKLCIEKEYIEKFIEIFMCNFKEYFFYNTNIKKLYISGEKGAYYPLELHVSLTNICIQKCKHCYKSANENGVFIDYNQLIDFLDSMREFVPYLTLSGGEPTLHPAFSKLMDRYSDTYNTCVLTSGVNFNDGIWESVKKAKRGMVVSIYSANAERHDIFADKKDSFNSIMKTIDNAKKLGISIGVSTMITEDNENDIDALIELLKNKNINNITVGKISNLGRAQKENLVKNDVLPQEMEIILERLKKKHSQIDIMESESSCEIPYAVLKCMAGTLVWSVYEDGQIHPCGMCKNEKMKIGEIDNFNKDIIYNRESYIKEIYGDSYLQSDKKCPFI